MKKRISLILTFIILAVIMIIPAKESLAANKKILTMEATQNNGLIWVSGTAEEGALAVAIAVYNEDGTELVTMQTTSVNSESKFSDSISVEKGKYLVKVADYEGGEYKEATVSIVDEETTSNESDTNASPKAGDKLIIYAGALLASVILLAFIIKSKTKKNNRK